MFDGIRHSPNHSFIMQQRCTAGGAKKLSRVKHHPAFSINRTMIMNTSHSAINPRLYSTTDISREQTKADLNFAIGLNRKILKLLGLWSYPQESQYQTIRSKCITIFFVISIFSFIVFPDTLALIKVWGNLTLIIDNLMINLPCTISLLKLLISWYDKKALGEIFDKIEKDWFEERSPKERDVMIKYAKLTRIVTLVGVGSSIFCVIAYFNPLIFGVIPRTITNLTDKAERALPMQSVYLYDISSSRRFYLTEFSQFIGCCCAVPAYVGTDVLFGMAILHCCGQCEILSTRIQSIVKKKPHNFQSLLKMHVQSHYRQIRYIELIKAIFKQLILALFGSVAISVAVLEFQMINALLDYTTDISVLKMYTYIQILSSCLFLIFIYTWMGEHLINQGEAIHAAIYNCNWHYLEPKASSQLIIMLAGTQKPLQFLAGNLIPVRLRSFGSLLKTTAGYVSFLLAIKR